MLKSYILFVSLFISQICVAQQTLDSKSFIREFEEIRQREQRSHQRLSGATTEGLAGYTVASNNFDVHHIRFNWFIDPAIRYIRGTVTFSYTITQGTNNITFDLLNALQVDSVKWHGTSISFQRLAEDGVVLNFPSNIPAGTKDSVSISYQGVPGGSGFGTFYQGTQSSIPVIWTLSEPYGARDWWPCKNNLIDKTDSLDIFISCPQQFQPSSNGVIQSNTVTSGTRTTHFKHRHLISSYLVAIAVTNYTITNDTIQTTAGVVPYQNFAYPTSSSGFNGYKSFHRNAFKTFTKLFGAYPYIDEKYGHTQWGWGGGMEHQTNSFVNMPTPNLATHELAHQWFGDLITCGSWQDIWLNEGFATYLTLLMVEDSYNHNYWSTLGSIYVSAISDSTGSVFCTDTTSESRIFSAALSYNKGGYVLHMLRGALGDSTFFRGIRRYLNDPKVRNGFAFTADFQRNMEAESGQDLDWFFQEWIYGGGYPRYYAEWNQNKNNWVKVKLKQTTTHNSVPFFEMPVTLVLANGTQELKQVVRHTYSGQEFWINAGFAVDTVMIDPDYWILSKVRNSVKVAAATTIDDIKIYPNPSTGPVNVSISNPTGSKLYLRLYNSIGQLIYQRDLDTPGRDELITIPSTVFARGTYLLQVRNNKEIKLVKKIVR